MFKHLSLSFLAVMTTALCKAQPATTPELQHVIDLNVGIGQALHVGPTPHGTRNIVPITGGTFQGPGIRGTILGGGADYQMMSADKGRNELEAIYNLRTDDGVTIHIRNRGIATDSYFYCTPTFEAPSGSPYAWLNNAVFVCRPIGFKSDSIRLRVWKVCDAYDFDASISAIRPIPDELRRPASRQGRIETFTYSTARNGHTLKKNARVYLPYGYKAKDKRMKYDVLYLMHGGGDNSTSFLTPPKDWLPLRQVLDHLIAKRLIRPVIVVTPTFYDDDEHIGANSMNDAIAQTRNFHRELQHDLIPAVETHYNTHLTGRDSLAITRSRTHRAYGGFSMGALSTWYQLAYGIHAVKYYLPLSGDLWMYDEKGEKQTAQTAAGWLNRRIAASPFADDIEIYGYTGTKDVAGNPQKALTEAIDRYAPALHCRGPHANVHLAMKEGGQHYYGDINEYLYWALQTLYGPKGK